MGVRALGVNHVAFEVDDLDAALKALGVADIGKSERARQEIAKKGLA